MVSKRSTSAHDVQIGRAVRSHREERGISQQVLARKIGVSFQQLQKYESGSNRISAGRLAQIAQALSAPMNAFFAKATQTPTFEKGLSEADLELLEFQRSAEGRELLLAFQSIRHRGTRRRIIHLVRTVADARDKAVKDGA
jgi:transcriptional regulator with XRE-family HTH domain